MGAYRNVKCIEDPGDDSERQNPACYFIQPSITIPQYGDLLICQKIP